MITGKKSSFLDLPEPSGGITCPDDPTDLDVAAPASDVAVLHADTGHHTFLSPDAGQDTATLPVSRHPRRVLTSQSPDMIHVPDLLITAIHAASCIAAGM